MLVLRRNCRVVSSWQTLRDGTVCHIASVRFAWLAGYGLLVYTHMTCQGGKLPPVSEIVISARSLLTMRFHELCLARGNAFRNEHAPDTGCGNDVDTRALGRAASLTGLITGPLETQQEPGLTHNILTPIVKERLQLLHPRSCHANPPSYFPPQDGDAAKGMVILTQPRRTDGHDRLKLKKGVVLAAITALSIEMRVEKGFENFPEKPTDGFDCKDGENGYGPWFVYWDLEHCTNFVEINDTIQVEGVDSAGINPITRQINLKARVVNLTKSSLKEGQLSANVLAIETVHVIIHVPHGRFFSAFQPREVFPTVVEDLLYHLLLPFNLFLLTCLLLPCFVAQTLVSGVSHDLRSVVWDFSDKLHMFLLGLLRFVFGSVSLNT